MRLPSTRWAVLTVAFLLGSSFVAAATPVASSGPSTEVLTPKALARHIDQAIDRNLAAEKVIASPRASDAEFLRRVTLDLVGHIPSADRAAAFLDDKDPDKRARLVDQLLASSEFGKHQADIWQALLIPRSTETRLIPRDEMSKWLEERFNSNKGWDKTVHELLTASGELKDNAALTYFFANNSPDKLTDSVTRLFLGVQLQCAQCHNHPFTSWKQDEYWGMAAFFTRVRFQGNPQQALRQGGSVTVSESGRGRQLRLPVSAKKVAPQLLQGQTVTVRANEPLRPVLADWLTRPKNPFFGKAIVNRVWGQMFGRGLVNPVDDMLDVNPPSHPGLLEELADQLAAHRYQLKYLYRALCLSEAYQRTSRPANGNEDAAPELYARMPIKVLTPEQLFDSYVAVLGTPAQPNAPRNLTPQQQQQRRFALTPRTAFVVFFGAEDGADPTEYQGGIPQALRLMNAPAFNNSPALRRLLERDPGPEKVLEHLFLTTLTRRPTAAEQTRFLGYLEKQTGPRRAAYADILWVLLNSSEFTLNH